jgi:hypothetical protein
MSTIVVQHRITNPERFFGLTAEVTENAPAGIRPQQFCPSQGRTQAVCLAESAFGLPESAATSA